MKLWHLRTAAFALIVQVCAVFAFEPKTGGDVAEPAVPVFVMAGDANASPATATQATDETSTEVDVRSWRVTGKSKPKPSPKG